MTTIAYRDGIMAADRAAHLGNDWKKPDRATKIIHLADGSLFAGTGDTGVFSKLLEWFQTPEVDRGERPEISECDALLLDPDGRLWFFTGAGKRLVDAPFAAIGSGAPVAYGAMYAGATAPRAVEIAALVDPWTGGEIQVETLK
jgi:ATP-dependent protease HslVU (ClpYQ) peptidase subunit